MRREPRSRHQNIFAGGLGQRIILRGMALGGLSYWLFQERLAADNTLQYAQTMAFATLIFAQLWHIFDSRSSTTLFRKHPFGNRMLLAYRRPDQKAWVVCPVVSLRSRALNRQRDYHGQSISSPGVPLRRRRCCFWPRPFPDRAHRLARRHLDSPDAVRQQVSGA